MSKISFKLGVLSIWLVAASWASAQVPIAFSPCAPAPGEAAVDPTFDRLCPADIAGSGIFISGASASTHRELADIFRFDQPSDVTTDRIRSIGQELSRTGRYDDISIQPSGNRIEVTLVEKPRTASVSFSGNTVFRDQELGLLANLSIGDFVTRDGLIARSESILLAYQERGYFGATIVPDAQPTSSFTTANGLDLTLRIEEGVVAPLSQVLFSGNERLTAEELRSGLTTPSLGTVADLTEEIISADQLKILEAYDARGFGRTNVAARIITLDADGVPAGGNRQAASVALVFDIEEREGFRVGDIEVEGVETDSELSLDRGEDFDPELTADAARALAEELNSTSEIDLGVRTEFGVDQDSGEIDVTFVVFEIPPRQVANVRFTGNEQTAEAYLESVFDVPVGSTVSSKDLQEAAQRLGNTGLFTSISLSEDPAPDGQVAIVVNLEEDKTGVQRIGASYSSIYGLSLTAGVEERNWRGRGLHAGVSTRLAEDTAELRFFMINPRFQQAENRIFSAELTLRESYSEALDYSTRSALLATSLTRPMGERTSETWTLSVDASEIGNLGPNASLQARAEAERTRTQVALSYGASWVDLPKEDDPNAAAQASSYVRAVYPDQADPYVRVGGQARRTRSIGDGERALFTARASIDHVAPIGSSSELSQSQRLFDPTVRVRGFEDGGFAPIERDGSLVGGDTAFGASLQLQYHLIRSEALPVYSSLFLDMGTVYDRGESYVDVVNGVTTEFFESSDLRVSAGVGFSIETPAGFLTLTYAVPQVMEDFDREERLQFSLGGSL